jgi:hypothetical protein
MSNHHPLPSFIVIGAGRSGTTSLYYYLKQHPQISMSSIKETNYFAYDPGTQHRFLHSEKMDFPVKDLKTYQKLFSIHPSTVAIGEASPIYLWHPSAPGNINELIPDAKLIAILRNPVDRACSAYMHYVSIGMEKRTFAAAMAEEAQHKINGQWPLGTMIYVGLGFYFQQLTRYLNYFDREQILIFLYDDFQADPVQVMQKIFSFIGARASFVPDMRGRYNSSGMPKNKFIHFILQPRQFTKKLRRHLPKKIHDPVFNLLMRKKNDNLIKTSVDGEICMRLIDIYHGDVVALGNLLNRDLSRWLSASA